MPDSDIVEIFNHCNTIHNETKSLHKNVMKWLGITAVAGIITGLLFSMTIQRSPSEYVETISLGLKILYGFAIGMGFITFISFIVFIVVSVKAKPYSKNVTVFKDLIDSIKIRDKDFFTKHDLKNHFFKSFDSILLSEVKVVDRTSTTFKIPTIIVTI